MMVPKGAQSPALISPGLSQALWVKPMGFRTVSGPSF
jgi:hypothetical protein